MADQIKISNGDKEKIVPRAEAERIEENDEIRGYIIDTDQDIRIATAHEQNMIANALPIPANTTFSLDPMGNEIWSFADGADATLVMQYARFRIGDLD